MGKYKKTILANMISFPNNSSRNHSLSPSLKSAVKKARITKTSVSVIIVPLIEVMLARDFPKPSLLAAGKAMSVLLESIIQV